MQRTCWLWCIGVLMTAAACGAGDIRDGRVAGDSTLVADAEVEEDYEVLLGTPLADTLRGDARFGLVTDSDTGQNVFVIELQTGFDFAGGFFVAHGASTPPRPGTHDLVPLSDSLKSVLPGRYSIFYRQGMLKNLVSREGTVTFSTVTDTLIEGTFDALLYGFVAKGRQRLPNAEIRARGHFSARPGSPGFIIGL